MGTIAAELLKLRRSHAWAVVVVLPLVIAGAGTLNTVVSGQGLADGWHTLWVRTVVFYGLFPLSLGVAVLASLTWRAEHRHGNWNALMASPVAARQIMTAKIVVVSLLAAAMQVVMLGAVVALGTLVFGLDGLPPAQLFVVSGLIVLACVPVAAAQTWLSMRLRSFAAPVAIAAVAAGVAVVLLVAVVEAAIAVLPQALAARATHLGTGTFGDSGALTAAGAVPVVASSLLLTVVFGLGGSWALDRRGRGRRGSVGHCVAPFR